MKRLYRTINRLLEFPFDPTNDETNKVNITSALVNLGILLILLYIPPGIAARGAASPVMIVGYVILMVLISLQFAIWRGFGELVSKIALAVSWVLCQIVFLGFENGLRAPAYSACLAFLIAYAGLLHGKLGAILVTTASLVTSFMVVLLEQNQIFIVTPKMPSILWAAFGQLLFFSGLAFLIIKAQGNLAKTVQILRKEFADRLEKEREVRELNKELILAYNSTLEGWARALEIRDMETAGHSRRVVTLAWKLAKALNLSEEELIDIRYGALLHDIGKMGIPDDILSKPGPLTSEERETIEQHPMIAYTLLKDIRFLEKASSIPVYHHERWNGQGYPKGLKGEEIPLAARIFAVVDNWDALLSDRPYRKAWSKQAVIEYLREQSGEMFDPQVVEVFLSEVVKAND